MSNVTDFLTVDYASYFGVTWDPTTMSIRLETPASRCFEIEDKKPTIVQPAGKGVSVIRSTAESVEVIDLEYFTWLIHGSNLPSCCDFVISPCVGTGFLLLNELTRTQSIYIQSFKQPKTGIEQEGKLEKAKHQLEATINRFYEVSNFCDQYTNKTALFSCRLSDYNRSGIMARSAKSFNRQIYKIQRMRLHEALPHGFVFEMRVYDGEFRIN